jgi:hypothetical protein
MRKSVKEPCFELGFPNPAYIAGVLFELLTLGF